MIFRIVTGIAAVGILIVFFVLNPAETPLFPKCILYSATGYYCPGCGSQRAIHNLLHLNFAGVAGSNLLFIPAALLIIYHYSRTFLNKKLNLRLPNIFYFKNTPWIILGVVAVFWILRNLPVFPFSVLSPG